MLDSGFYLSAFGTWLLAAAVCMAGFRGHGHQQRDAVGGSGPRSFSCFSLEHARTSLRLSNLRRGGGSSKINTSLTPLSEGDFSKCQEGTAAHTRPAHSPCGHQDLSLTLVPTLQPISGQSQTSVSPSVVVWPLPAAAFTLNPVLARSGCFCVC